MTGMRARECEWCGDRFGIESRNSPARYCKRSHKTAAEKRRAATKARPSRPCPTPELRAEPIRGHARAAARRLGRQLIDCECGNFHVITEAEVTA